MAGLNISPEANLDGIDLWQSLSEGLSGARMEVVNNIDPLVPYTSYLHGHWKYVNGTVNPVYDTWLGQIPTDENPNASNYTVELFSTPVWETLRKFQEKDVSCERVLQLREESQVQCPTLPNTDPLLKCDPLVAPCLFNLQEDPCERINLARKEPKKFREMEVLVENARKKMVHPLNQPFDPKCDPALNDNQWTYWTDLLEERTKLVYTMDL